MLFLGQFKKAM